MKKISEILAETKPVKLKNQSTEFQIFGIYLADTLGDPKHYSLYIKLAKQYPRGLLEQALNYTKDYSQAKSKAKLFMWKLKELKKNGKI